MAKIESITLTLGEKEYEVKPPGFKKSRAWRERFLQELKPLLGQVGDITTADWSKPSDLLSLFPIAETMLVDGLDTTFDLLIEFSPVLMQDKAIIEAEATDRQVWESFMEVIKLIDPFGVSRVLGRRSGRIMTTMESNLQLVNGASPSSGPNNSQNNNLPDSSDPTTAENSTKPS